MTTTPTDEELARIRKQAAGYMTGSNDTIAQDEQGNRALFEAGRAAAEQEMNERIRLAVHAAAEAIGPEYETFGETNERLKSELADALRGDPDGHLLSVYQVLRGSNEVAADLFDGDDPHYERVIAAARKVVQERMAYLLTPANYHEANRWLLESEDPSRRNGAHWWLAGLEGREPPRSGTAAYMVYLRGAQERTRLLAGKPDGA